MSDRSSDSSHDNGDGGGGGAAAVLHGEPCLVKHSDETELTKRNGELENEGEEPEQRGGGRPRKQGPPPPRRDPRGDVHQRARERGLRAGTDGVRLQAS